MYPRLHKTALMILMAAGFSIPAMSQTPPARMEGAMLVGPAGMSLYTFDKDTEGSGKSVCNGPCAANWPPLAAADGATGSGDFSVASRDDGSKQWAYKGRPLYYWSKDQKPGDTTGDGFNKVWRLAR